MEAIELVRELAHRFLEENPEEKEVLENTTGQGLCDHFSYAFQDWIAGQHVDCTTRLIHGLFRDADYLESIGAPKRYHDVRHLLDWHTALVVMTPAGVEVVVDFTIRQFVGEEVGVPDEHFDMPEIWYPEPPPRWA